MAETTTTTTSPPPKTCRVAHQLRTLTPQDCAIFVTVKPGERIELPTAPRLQQLRPSLQLQLETYRRWNSSLSLGFLRSIEHLEINDTRADKDNEPQFILAVFLSPPVSRLPTSPCYPKGDTLHTHHISNSRPTFIVERSFGDFEELRKNVLKTVCSIPQCTCPYCMDFVIYIRFKFSQPRGIAKLMSGTEKRKQLLERFIQNFVMMGQRRARTPGIRKCQAQSRVPAMVKAFLLNNAKTNWLE
uniref:PX domain-containing protein n=1 Tax=Hyaloperonospora arabidopsidis (strain Emoy2) TaxID=559515 RepID=M4B5I1_HYAAE